MMHPESDRNKRGRAQAGARDLPAAVVVPADLLLRQQRLVHLRDAVLALQHRQYGANNNHRNLCRNNHPDVIYNNQNNNNNNAVINYGNPNDPILPRGRRVLVVRPPPGGFGVVQGRRRPFLPIEAFGAALEAGREQVAGAQFPPPAPPVIVDAMERGAYPNLQLPPEVERLIAVGDMNGVKIAVGEDNLVSYLPERPVGTAVHRFQEMLCPGGRCYFEVEIVNMVKGGQIVIGLMPYEACQRIATASPVGSTKNSIGLNLNGGLLLQSSCAPSHFGPRCHNRDIIGIGMHFGQRAVSGIKNNVSVFFTHNGKEFGSREIILLGQRFVPAVSLNQPGERVRFRLDASWPPESREDGEDMQCDHFDDLWDRLSDVRLNGDVIEYAGSGLSNNDVGFAQAAQPLTPSQHYFELEILDSGESCYIAIGVAHRQYSCKQHPGWNKGSIAYHADDGEVFIENGTGEERAPVCGRGDRMGCGILFPSNLEEMRQAALEEIAAGAAEDAREGGRGGGDNPVARYRAEMHNGRLLMLQCRRRGDNQRYRIHRQLQAAANGGVNGVELWAHSRVEIDDYFPHEQLDCGIRVKVFFTRNGQIVCTKEMALPQEGFFPTVGLLSRGEKIRVDLQPLSG